MSSASRTPRFNPFSGGIFSVVILWLLLMAFVAVVVVLGVLFGRAEEVVNAVMLTLAVMGHVVAIPCVWLLGAEIRATRNDLERLFRLPPGAPIPDNLSLFQTPLQSHLKYLRSLGINGRSGCREALARLTEIGWHECNARLKAMAMALVTLGVVFTMLGLTILGQGLSEEIAKPGADITAAVKAALPAMGTATASSLIGGFGGGVSLLFITALMTAKVETYGAALRTILEFADFGDDWFDDETDDEEGAN